VRGAPCVVFHDAYQYFRRRFDVPAAGAIALFDATDPGPARGAEVRDLVADLGAVCVFAEPQFDAGIVEAVLGDGEVRTAVLDPLGVGLERRAELYFAMMRGRARDLADRLR
jgi:zinc transport system substrate-binding protein